MRKGAGLALLAIASIYQLNKINKRKVREKAIDAEVRKELFTKSEAAAARKSPIQIIKEAQLKAKEDLDCNESSLETSKKLINQDESSEIKIDIESSKKSNLKEDEQIEDESVQEVTETAEPSVVYIVGKGRKYHLTKDCRGVKKDAELTELTLQEAIDKGYTLCGWEK